MRGSAEVKGAVDSSFKFYRVPSNLYQPGDLIEEDLYFLYQGNHILYRLKNLPWKVEDRKKLEEFGVTDLYIRCNNEKSHHYFLENHLNRILDEPNISSKDKAQILYSTSISVVEDCFLKADSSENLKRSMSSVKNSIDFLSKDKNHFFELMSLAQKDFSEYTHALQVSAYAITLAKHIGIKTYNHISALGIASILHDIGKVKIDNRLLNKAGELTATERSIVEKHPELGYEIVHRMGTIPELSEQIILQHHERPDGSGYPKRLKDSEINVMAKIVSLVDCFDALTSDRNYRQASSPLEAVEQMRGELKDEYDQKLLVEFIRMLKK